MGLFVACYILLHTRVQVCAKCQVEKAAEEFNSNKVRPDGLCSYCKVCNAAAAAEWRRKRAKVTEPTVSHKVGCLSLPFSAVIRVLVSDESPGSAGGGRSFVPRLEIFHSLYYVTQTDYHAARSENRH